MATALQPRALALAAQLARQAPTYGFAAQAALLVRPSTAQCIAYARPALGAEKARPLRGAAPRSRRCC